MVHPKGSLRIKLLNLSLLVHLASCEKADFKGQSASEQSMNEAPTGSQDTVEENQANPEEAPAATPAAPQTQAGGVPGGHFDLDTSIQTYAFDAGTTEQHVHQYDDKFNVTGVDFFKLLDPKFVEPIEVIKPDQSFKIIVANAQLSPGARVTINGQTFSAIDWQKRSQNGDLPVFSLNGATGTQKLSSMNVTFDPLKPISAQLIPTVTDLVRSNAPGPGQTYRAGALTIQLIDAQIGQIDTLLGVAKIGAPGMLWESTLFWHAEKAK
jgi:hypothetical protein